MSKEDKKGTGDDNDDVVKHNQAELFAENITLKNEKKRLEETIADLTLKLDTAERQLEEQAKGKKIQRIQRVSNLGIEYLSSKSLAELDEIEEICNSSKLKFMSPGDAGKFVDSVEEAHDSLRTMYKYGKKR